MRNCLPLAALIAGIAAAMPAQAVVTYDTSLASPGVYFGAGNANNHYTINTANGTELGLTTVQRYVGNVTPDAGTSTYRVPLGNTTYPSKQGSYWGFTFSLNDGPNGPNLNQISVSLSVLDVAAGTTTTINPLLIPDNSGYNASGPNVAASNLATDYAVQNSEALSFSNGVASAFDPAYNSAIDDTFVITLVAACTDACTKGAAPLGSISETVIAGNGAPSVSTPEPVSAAILGAGLTVLGFVRRKRA